MVVTHEVDVDVKLDAERQVYPRQLTALLTAVKLPQVDHVWRYRVFSPYNTLLHLLW